MWELWIWRKDSGWWLANRGYDNAADAAAGAEEYQRSHKLPPEAFAFAVVPLNEFNHLWGAPISKTKQRGKAK